MVGSGPESRKHRNRIRAYRNAESSKFVIHRRTIELFAEVWAYGDVQAVQQISTKS